MALEGERNTLRDSNLGDVSPGATHYVILGEKMPGADSALIRHRPLGSRCRASGPEHVERVQSAMKDRHASGSALALSHPKGHVHPAVPIEVPSEEERVHLPEQKLRLRPRCPR